MKSHFEVVIVVKIKIVLLVYILKTRFVLTQQTIFEAIN